MPINDYGLLGNDIKVYATKIQKKHSEYFAFARSINQLGHTLKNSLEIDVNNGQQVIGTRLFTKIHESFQAVVILLSHGLTTDSECLLRCALEALYLQKFIKENSDNVKLYLSSSRLNDLTKIHNMIDEIGDLLNEDELSELEKEFLSLKYRGLKISDIVEKSNMNSWHKSIYPMLSHSVHSSPYILETRFKRKEGGEYKEMLFGPNDDAQVAKNLMLGVEILLFSLAYLENIFGHEWGDDLNPAYDEFTTLSDKSWSET